MAMECSHSLIHRDLSAIQGKRGKEGKMVDGFAWREFADTEIRRRKIRMSQITVQATFFPSLVIPRDCAGVHFRTAISFDVSLLP